MKFYTVTLILLFAVVSVVLATHDDDYHHKKPHPCGPHEVWDDCGPPQGGCEKNCHNRFKHLACATVCTAKCYCKIGYIKRHDDGPCIREDECPKKCHYKKPK